MKQTLKEIVYSMYIARCKMEKLRNPKVFKNINIPGKLIEHSLDLYVEFIQMNNREIIVIKIIEGSIVTEKDIWDFTNVINDLKFFPRAVIYFDQDISKKAIEMAQKCNIQTKKFNFSKEVARNVSLALQVLLPNNEVIGDPFWTMMEIDLNGNVNGNYFTLENTILLFLSKKQAKIWAEKQNSLGTSNYSVFGLSQEHLRILIDLVEKTNSDNKFGIVLSQYEQCSLNEFKVFSIDSIYLREYYLRK